MASDTDLIGPAQALDLHQRSSSTVLQLVHTEEVTALVLLTSMRSRSSDWIRSSAPYRAAWSRSAMSMVDRPLDSIVNSSNPGGPLCSARPR